MNSSEIVWKNPKASSRQPWVERLAPLVDHPERWALLSTRGLDSVRRTAYLLTGGKLTRPPGRWEFVSRKIDGDTGELYGRYLGDLVD